MSDSPRQDPMHEVQRLLSLLTDGVLTDAQEQRLANILANNTEARAMYLDYFEAHAILQWEHSHAEADAVWNP